MINFIYKHKGERIWRWKFRLDSVGSKVLDVSLGTTDKQVAEKKRGELLREKEHEKAGLMPVKAVRDSARRELIKHIVDFTGDLRSQRRNHRYIGSIEYQLTELADKCEWTYPQDVSADSFIVWRNAQSKAAKTLNEYLTSAKGFCSWLVAQGRIPVNPLATVKKVEARGHEVRVRRAFAEIELTGLLSVAGPQRIVYLTAALTGIRHGELKELRWHDFNLGGEKPSVTVRASVSKNHKQACLPLHPALATALREFRLVNADAGDLAFKGLVPRSKVFTGHLKAAKISKVDTQGRVVDFHSLRHTFCTNLHRVGVPQREAMELMRHSDPRLTASTYTDASLLSLKTAVEKLTVQPPQIAPQILGATGQTVTQFVAGCPQVQADETIVNKGEKSLSGAASRILSKIEKWCALQVSNLRPLPCEGNALPLS
jgi:integrase